MANKNLFKSLLGKLVPKTDTVNEAGGNAYALTAKHALAQYAATGCLNATFYASAEMQLETILSLCSKVEPEYIARVALYARSSGKMKDLPALLCAVLSVRSPGLLAEVFDRVIDSPKMLRNFVQIMRSGVVGRKSLGSLPKRLVLQWLAARSDEALFRGSVGNDPSMADVIRMVHPKPSSPSREALYGYLVGDEYAADALPELVRQFEAFKQNRENTLPDLPFEMLTALPLTKEHWIGIARNASWTMTRMNLNTFLRHGVFEDKEMPSLVAKRLSDPAAVAKSNVMPYQLMMAYTAAKQEMPGVITEALQDAMEIAIRNVPVIDGKVYILPDVSGSMQSPVTGHRAGATTAVRCIDVAALISAAILRANPSAQALPFDTAVVPIKVNPRDSVMTTAKALASIGGGGTSCSVPLAKLNVEKAKGDLILYVSDNESWADPKVNRGTATIQEWNVFKQRNPGAKLVCIDIQPHAHTQAPDRGDIMNIGGFSDAVFDVVSLFTQGKLTGEHWVGVIEKVSL